MSKYIEIPDDGIIRIPIMDGDRTVGERCVDLSDMLTVDAKLVVHGDLISREELRKTIVAVECCHCVDDTDCEICSLTPILKCIDKAPTIEAKPVVRGDWDDADNRTEYTVVRCSCCGKGFGKPIAMAVYNFCPNCGADMRGADG